MLSGVKLEYDHLYKFLTSLGLILITASLLMPWVYLQSVGNNTITQNNFNDLTELSKQIIESRQNKLLLINHSLIFISGFIFFVGIILLVYGLYNWNSLQKKKDAGEISEINKTVAQNDNIIMATQEEKKKQSIQEAREAQVADAQEVPISEPENDKDSSVKEFKDDEKIPDSEKKNDLNSRLEMALEGEKSIFDSLFSAYSLENDKVQIIASAVLKNSANRRIMDVLIDPQNKSFYGQLAIEVKISSKINFMLLDRGMLQASLIAKELRDGRVYTGKREQPPLAKINSILLNIVDEIPKDIDNLCKHVEKNNEVFSKNVGVLIIEKRKMNSLEPEKMRELVTRLWSGGDAVCVY